jgi:hypothetical protein
MITTTQINNIHKLSSDDCLLIMHECAERLGCVSVDQYSKIMNVPRRTIYLKMSENKLKYFAIDNHKFPLINEI